MIVIIDYDMGNVGSIQNMLKKVGASSVISRDPTAISEAKGLILPGVGSFDAGMKCLTQYGLDVALRRRVLDARVPILGLCLGMQLMTSGSEEGSSSGLGWVDAECKRFRFGATEINYRVPHMGWNSVEFIRSPFPDYEINDRPRFYFVHSYYVKCHQSQDVIAHANYGQEFVAGFQVNNIVGVQFHPEKSHKFGMRLLEAFARSC